MDRAHPALTRCAGPRRARARYPAAVIPATPLSHGQRVRELRTAAFRLLETRHPQGMVLGRHAHEHSCVNFVLAGCYREDVGREQGAFEPLTSYYKPAHEPHANRFLDAPARCLLVEVCGEELTAPGVELRRVAWTRDPATARPALALWRELADPDGCSALAVDQLGLELVEGVLAPPSRRTEASKRVRAATDVLHDDPREAWTLSELARHVGLHPSHLARAFRAQHGCTVGDYLRRLRLGAVARALALEEWPIAELASDLGFADQSHCTRAFRRWLGTTPAAYRRAFRRGGSA
jgi:AraC family transcriptional regulator